MLDPRLLATERVRPLRIAEYLRLAEAGVFEDERVELLAGWLVEMSPLGQRHIRATSRIMTALARALGHRRDLEVQAPSTLQIGDHSMPEPDVAIVKASGWDAGHARTALLVVEVSDTSLAKDRGIKLPIYAAAGVAEYWIVDLSAGRVEIYTRPKGGRYQRRAVVTRSGTLRPVKLRGIEIRAADVVPPPRKNKAKARRGH